MGQRERGRSAASGYRISRACAGVVSASSGESSDEEGVAEFAADGDGDGDGDEREFSLSLSLSSSRSRGLRGRTRFSLSPTLPKGRRRPKRSVAAVGAAPTLDAKGGAPTPLLGRLRFRDSDEEEEEEESSSYRPRPYPYSLPPRRRRRTSFPSSRGDRFSNPSETAALLAHHRRLTATGSAQAVDRVSNLLRAATLLDYSTVDGGCGPAGARPPPHPPSVALSPYPYPRRHPPPHPAAAEAAAIGLWALAEASGTESLRVRAEADRERVRAESERLDAANALRRLLRSDEELAARALERERAEKEARERKERIRLGEERERAEREETERREIGERAEEERRGRVERAEEERRVRAETEAEERRGRAEAAEVRVRQREERLAGLEAEEARKYSYADRARKLVSKLTEVKATLVPFEKSGEASRRRLGMKKVVRGRINTLSLDVNKIRSVASEVVRAIDQARADDEPLKKRIEAGEAVPKELARGKRYLLNSISSNVIVRVQAEGFNGTRGDGFPLAGLLSMVSVRARDLVPLLEAHIYTVCPTAVPMLPDVKEGGTEDEFMESLGMLRDKKTGDFETFDRFLGRTEVRPLLAGCGVVGLVATDVFCSNAKEISTRCSISRATDPRISCSFEVRRGSLLAFLLVIRGFPRQA